MKTEITKDYILDIFATALENYLKELMRKTGNPRSEQEIKTMFSNICMHWLNKNINK